MEKSPWELTVRGTTKTLFVGESSFLVEADCGDYEALAEEFQFLVYYLVLHV